MRTRLQYLSTVFLPIMYSLIVIVSVFLNFIADSNTLYFQENSFLSTVIFVLIYVYFRKRFTKDFINLNEKWIVRIVALLITFLYIISYLTHNYFVSVNHLNSFKFAIFCFIKTIGYFIVFYGVVYEIFKLLSKIDINKRDVKQNTFFTNNKKSFFLILISIMVCNIPYLIDSYPGYISYDFAIQIRQALGFEPIVDHHPYISTYIIKCCIQLGYKIANSYNFGIFIYTLLQTLLYAAISSYFIFYMANIGISKWYRVLFFAIVILFPYSKFNNCWLTKDIMFAFGIYLLSLQIWKISNNENKCCFKNYVLLFVSLLLIMTFRKNGVYIIVLSAFIYLLFKKVRKPVVAVFSVVIVLFTIVNIPVKNHLGIKDGSVNEMFSIPIQQMARIYKYDNEKLSETDKEDILSYFNDERIDELYDPLLADPVKAVMKEDLTTAEKIDFLKLSLKLLVKYPSTSFKSFSCTTYNFYYINNEQFRGIGGFKQQSEYSEEVLLPQDWSIKSSEGINGFRMIDNIISTKNIPILNLITNTGFFVNLYIVLIGYIICTKKYEKLATFVPVILVFITQLAGPVVDQRYTYSLILTAPLLICVTLHKSFKKSESTEFLN